MTPAVSGCNTPRVNGSLPYLTGATVQELVTNRNAYHAYGEFTLDNTERQNFAGYQYQLHPADNPYQSALLMIEEETRRYGVQQRYEPGDSMTSHPDILEAGDLDRSGMFGDTAQETALGLVAMDWMGNGLVDGRIHFQEDEDRWRSLVSESDFSTFAQAIERVRAEYVAE